MHDVRGHNSIPGRQQRERSLLQWQSAPSISPVIIICLCLSLLFPHFLDRAEGVRKWLRPCPVPFSLASLSCSIWIWISKQGSFHRWARYFLCFEGSPHTWFFQEMRFLAPKTLAREEGSAMWELWSKKHKKAPSHQESKPWPFPAQCPSFLPPFVLGRCRSYFSVAAIW